MPFLPFSHLRWRWSAARRPPAQPVPDPVGPREPTLAEEAEAFLNGELAELHVANQMPLPPWIVLNRLAHTDAQVLSQLVQGEEAPGPVPGPAGDDQAWSVAERSLALALLSSGSSPDDVRLIQRTVLVPLELALISRATTEPFTVHRVIAEAIEALDAHDT